MIPFRVSFKPGISLYEQMVYAAKKAIVSGALRPSDPFPSVRALSREFKINPNTAHKVVLHLVREGLLETLPGVGTVVARMPQASLEARTELLGNEIEQLVVEARKLGIELEEVMTSIEAHWRRLGQGDSRKGREREPEGRKR